MRNALPSLDTLASLSGDASEVSKHLQHNVPLWRWINGAFGMLKDEALAFDTQQDYWYRTDRRTVATYLHRRLRESYYPAADPRALAQHLFRTSRGRWPREVLARPGSSGRRSGPSAGASTRRPSATSRTRPSTEG